MSDAAITITLSRDQAIVLDECLSRIFGDNDLHDWENIQFNFVEECEQWPFFTLRDALADQLSAELSAGNYNQILENARKSITAQQWGE